MALSLFSCLTVDEWETYVWPDTHPETSAAIRIGSGVTINEYNGHKVSWGTGLRFQNKYDFENITVDGVLVMVGENQVVLIPSGETTFVMNLRENKIRFEHNQPQFHNYHLKAYEFNYKFEKQKAYSIIFFVEEHFWNWKKNKWIVQVNNLTDKTNDKIIVKMGAYWTSD
jgi:hypothetical protein